MGIDEFVGEHEASTLAGVNPSTLRRYAEVGYLKPEVDSDGLRLYSRSEINSLFRLSSYESTNNVVQFPQKSSAEIEQNQEELTNEAPKFEGNIAVKPEITPQPSSPRIDARPFVELQNEIDRLRHMQVLNDQILDMYESRIGDLTKERDWLRVQIEQLNEQLSRDQVLLLTQTQTIAQAMAREYNKPTLMGRVMKLLGFDEQQENQKT